MVYRPLAVLLAAVQNPHSVDDFDPDLFWDQVRASGDCWNWTGRRYSNGYGYVQGYSFTEKFAHRLSWTMANGPIPGGMWVLHHCDNPPCVNPEHLYIGTAKDNAQDRERRGRGNHPVGFSGHGGGKPQTHCVHGHEFTSANTMLFGDGWKRCRLCQRARRAVYRAHKREIRQSRAVATVAHPSLSPGPKRASAPMTPPTDRA